MELISERVRAVVVALVPLDFLQPQVEYDACRGIVHPFERLHVSFPVIL